MSLETFLDSSPRSFHREIRPCKGIKKKGKKKISKAI